MKYNPTSLLFLVFVLFSAISTQASSDDFVSGFYAAERGEYKTAVNHWGPLASKGHAIAQFNIALMYHSGSGLPINEKEAIKWYQKSAENGYHKAQEYLAAGYANGWFGFKKDSQKAALWEEKAINSAPY